MESITLTTPSGYIVTFKPFVSFGIKRQIQRVFMASAKVDAAHPDKIDFSPAAMYDAQDLALKLLVTNVEVPGEKTVTTDPEAILTTIQDWPEQDGQAVYAKLDELTKDTRTPEKKGS